MIHSASIRRLLALTALSSCLLPSTKRLRHLPAGGMLSIFGEAVTIEQCEKKRKEKPKVFYSTNTILLYPPIVSGQASNRLAPVLNPAVTPSRYKSLPRFPGLAPGSHPTHSRDHFSNSITEAHTHTHTQGHSRRLTLRRPQKREALGVMNLTLQQKTKDNLPKQSPVVSKPYSVLLLLAL